MDGGNAGLACEIACCHYALEEFAEARPWFIRARESESRHDRARSRINEILLGIAATRARDGVHLADTGRALAEASPHGIEGPELFLDHVHPSFEGNCVLARCVLETLARVEPRLGIRVPAISTEECRLRQAMTPPDLRDQLAMAVPSYQSAGGQPTDGLEHKIAGLDAQIGAQAEDMRIKAYRRALEIDPGNNAVRTRYVRLLMDGKDWTNALEQGRILAINLPFSWDAHRLLARLLAGAGEREQAIAALHRALAVRPEDADAHIELGRLLQEDRPEAARAAFRTSFRLRPGAKALYETARVLLRQGDVSEAGRQLRRGLRFKPGNAAALEEFIIALSREDPAVTGTLWETLRSEAPDSASVAVAYGAVRAADCGPARAREALADALRLGGSDWNVCAKAGDAYVRIGAWSDAVTAYERAAALHPGARRQRLLIATGCCNEQDGDIPGAIDAYTQALLADPSDCESYWRLDAAFPKTSPDASAGLWEGIRARVPENAVLDVLCGESLAAANVSDAARARLEAALRLDGNDSNVLAHAGNAYASMADWAQAAACYERALELNPGLEYVRPRLEEARRRAAGV